MILEALDDYLYKISIELSDLKGQAMNNRRKELTKKQKLTEQLQHQIHLSTE